MSENVEINLRDELRQISKITNQRKLDEQKQRESEELEGWKDNVMYWRLSEVLWPKVYDRMKYSAREGLRRCTYCVTYKDF